MKLLNPINSTKKSTKFTNHVFPSTMVSSFLALLLCTTVTPKTQNHSANYIDPRPSTSNQTTQATDPGYNWFY
jgi:hypothetical protein